MPATMRTVAVQFSCTLNEQWCLSSRPATASWLAFTVRYLLGLAEMTGTG